MAYRYFSEKSRLAQDRWNIRALSVCMVWGPSDSGLFP